MVPHNPQSDAARQPHMHITIHGHTIPVTDLQHADRLLDIADRYRADDDTDGLEKWIYAGCPEGPDAEGGAK